MIALIETSTYTSTDHESHVELRVTFNGGNTFSVATVWNDGRIEGDLADKTSIIADCADEDFEIVSAWGETEIDMRIREQAQYDRDVYWEHQELLAEGL